MPLLRRVVVTAVVLIVSAVGTAPASADIPVALVAAPTPIAAHGSWVAWSERDTDGWRPVAAHDGVVRRFDIAPSPAPLDLDVGTDRDDRPVITFSRCTKAVAPWVGPWEAEGCRVKAVDLGTGQERAVHTARFQGQSDTSPSMWKGDVAFTRTTSRSDVSQVRLYEPGRSGRPRTLRHGAMPERCPFRSCEGLPRRGGVVGLDLGERFVAFRWAIDAPGVVGHFGWELRAVSRASGRTFLLGSGFAGEACTGGADGVSPLRPSVVGGSVWFASRTSRCFRTTVDLVRGRPSRTTPRIASGRLEVGAIAIAHARTASSTYVLLAPTPAGETEPTCTPQAPCVLTQVDTPDLDRVDRLPRKPFF